MRDHQVPWSYIKNISGHTINLNEKGGGVLILLPGNEIEYSPFKKEGEEESKDLQPPQLRYLIDSGMLRCAPCWGKRAEWGKGGRKIEI